MGDTQQRIRYQYRAEELSAVVLRALTGNMQLHFEGGRLYDNKQRVPAYAPHLQLRPGIDSLASYRGVADSQALRLLLSDAAEHEKWIPDQPVERLIFEWLEQLRVESLAPESWPGVRHNLILRYQTWSDAFLESGAAETSLGILLFAFSQIAWSRLMAHALPEHIQDLLEPTRAALAPALGEAFAGIRRCRHNQAGFAPYALQIARDIGQRVQSEYEDSPETANARRGAFTLSLDFEQDESDGFVLVHSGDSEAFIASQGQYRVFTSQYDQELQAASLVRQALLLAYREQLDQRLAKQGINIARLSRALRVLLAQPQRDGWRFGEEEGVIDGRRLAQLISSPGERRLFRRDQFKPVSNCTVSFLVDCSGSMKQYSTTLALMLDIFMRALEQAGVGTEILGFTTLAWNGGRARRDWLAQGRQPMPGRLNEACHLVFKEVDTSWRRARSQIVALMKADLFREGVDGEAVQWASQRLLERDYERRILIVLSDGCPMDGATSLANDAFYLDNHLKMVVRQYGQQGIEIIGLGVGLDLSPYYSRSMAIDLSDGLDNAVFDEFLYLLSGRRRR
ncbi:cobalt chelatase [Alcaligenaceae bacterium]|nr:cobalt chelatase [Alcaligenaceae bacterium]